MRKTRGGLITLLPSAAMMCVSCLDTLAEPNAGSAVVVAPGRVERAGNVMLIGAAVSATVSEVLVREGARVEPGQILVRLECAHLQKEADARKSHLAAMEAALKRVVQGTRPEEMAIALALV